MLLCGIISFLRYHVGTYKQFGGALFVGIADLLLSRFRVDFEGLVCTIMLVDPIDSRKIQAYSSLLPL